MGTWLLNDLVVTGVGGDTYERILVLLSYLLTLLISLLPASDTEPPPQLIPQLNQRTRPQTQNGTSHLK